MIRVIRYQNKNKENITANSIDFRQFFQSAFPKQMVNAIGRLLSAALLFGASLVLCGFQVAPS